MSNLIYYDDVKIIKKPLKQRVKSFFKVFLFIMIVVGCFVGARYLSSALTVGNITSIIVYGDTAVKKSKSSLFAVTLGSYDTESEASKVALGSTIQGASGFVWKGSDKYYVVGSVYSSREDASKVIENLSGTNYSTDILEITFPKLNINFDMYNNSDMPTIDDGIDAFDDVYERLYNYSITYDKGDITHLAVSSGISEMRGEVKGTIVNLQNIINRSTSKATIMQKYLVKLDEVLDQAILKTIDNTSTNYSIKNAIVSVVRLKYEMYNELM